jgi:hypothetical protein
VSRRLHTTLLAMLLALCAPAFADDRADESVEQYLAGLELSGLLADFLEARLATAPKSEEADIAARLAEVYANLLESAQTEEQQAMWERRSEALLLAVPEANTLELRLGLVRASFSRVERIAERRRLKLDTEDDDGTLTRRFSALVDRFAEVAEEANRIVIQLERQEESRATYDAELLSAALAEARRQRSIGNYLAGYAATYVAEINNDVGAAESALKHFGWLLNARTNTRPDLSRLPDQTLRYPHVARAAMATALCNAIRGRSDEALEWMQRVRDAPELAPGITDQWFTRRMILLARIGQWPALWSMVENHRSGPDGDSSLLEPSDARLLAILTFDAGAGDGGNLPLLDQLRDVALADLVGAGELGHVLQLAAAYGAERFGTDSFVSQQVRGLMAYDAARQAHLDSGADENEPTDDPAIAATYLEAATLFAHAARTPEALDLPAALGNTTMLIGLCHYYAGASGETEFTRASQWFVRASETVPEPARAADALWMAIRALDLEIENDPSSELRTQRDALIARFLSDFPGHERAAALTLRVATGGSMPPLEAIDLLLAIETDSPLFETARRHAARLSYGLFRSAIGPEHEWRGLRYLELAEPLLAIDRRLAFGGDADAAALAALRGRRIVEVALALDVPAIERAERALDAVRSLAGGGMVDASSFAAELEFRRAQLALSRGDEDLAEQIIDTLSQTEDERFADAGARMLYRRAETEWRRLRRADESGEATLDAATRVVRHGGRLVREVVEGDATEITSAEIVSLYVTVADAAADLALHANDSSMRERARSLYERILDRHPASAAVLRKIALLAEAAGDDEAALDAWRELLAGLDAGSPPWLEAKHAQITLLARVDRDRAVEVMQQHVVLYPQFGPEPWGDRLRALADQLGVQAP